MSHETIGERLHLARQAKSASLLEASQETKIRVDFLESMERNTFEFVSGATYVKGMLRSYARWLGLDSQALVQEFDRSYGTRPGPPLREILPEPVARAARKPRSAWLVAAVIAASVLLALSLVGVMSPPENELAKPPPAPRNGPAAQDRLAQEAQVGEAPPRYEGVNLVVTVVSDTSWLRVEADGNNAIPAYQGTMSAGETRTFQASGLLRVVFGSLGAVRLQWNGKDLGSPGGLGEVRTCTFTPQSASACSAKA